MKLLLVEDNADVLFLLRRALEQSSHEIIIAQCGYEAIDLLKSIKVDAVISDIMMPNGSGVWLLKEMERLKDQTPVLLMTAGASPPREEMLALGAKDLLRKPLDVSALERALDHLKKQD